MAGVGLNVLQAAGYDLGFLVCQKCDFLKRRFLFSPLVSTI